MIMTRMRHFTRLLSFAVVCWALCTALAAGGARHAAAAAPPNVVVILADDLGFSDLGCYGGEIDTPHLDRLAAGGLQFTEGYNTARCWPTRGALLTGYYAQSIRRDASPGIKGGNAGQRRPAWAKLLPELLASAGYRSYHSGKWHIDGDPRQQGFQRSLQIEGGQNDFFDPDGITVDGQPIEAGDGFYVTTAVGDHAAECLRDHAATHAGTPFFSYVAFTSPHFPLHAPQEVVTKYKARYQAGWDALREARYQRLVDRGIIDASLAPLEPEVGPPYQPKAEVLTRFGPGEIDRPRPWASLSPEQQAFQATKMAIHAAMVEVMDRAVGTIVGQLKAMNALDDTLVLFLSDNGASAEIMIRGKGHDPALPPGASGTYYCLGPGFSSCANTPFRRHKTWVHEGGIATPWIVHWPKGFSSRSALRSQPVHVIDVVPTVLELAGVAVPAEHAGQPVPPLQGKSFAACLTDPSAPPPHDTLWWCHNGHRAVRSGDWKLVAANNQPWELYDLARDRTETTNLASGQPDRVATLEKAWTTINEQCRHLAELDGQHGPPAPKQKAADTKVGQKKRPSASLAPQQRSDSPPNVVIIFADDMGYGDPACFGGGFAATPHIDRLAREGIRFTDFHVAQAVCSASRAALLTGCYPNRLGIHGALGPKDSHGLATAETTLPELLQTRGYRTGMVGKWHLGHHPPFLPTRHGFDEYFGLPYSNDMWPHHPEAKPGSYPPLPLLENETVIDAEITPADQETLTQRYAERAVQFIKQAGSAEDGRPFFLYLAHSMPHVPLFTSSEFRGSAPGGRYGDVIAEIDASVGAVLTALEETGNTKNTLVVFTSDNGPWLSYGNHAGSAGPLREGKGTAFEGGVCVPCVARLPDRIPAGTVSDEPLMTIDLLPSIARLTGNRLAQDAKGHCLVKGRRIDGHDRLEILCGGRRASDRPDTYLCYYNVNELQAVREGPWKLFFPHVYRTMQGQTPGKDGIPGRYRQERIGRALYNLASDPGEQHDVAAEHPEIVARLEQIAEAARADLGDSLTKRQGDGVRQPGRLAVAQTAASRPPSAAAPTASLTGRRPNIIYVMTDDQGYGDVASHGNPLLKTPHLDRLRNQSVRLTEYHVSPTCAPTRAALLTGRHEFRSGVTHTTLERERLALSATTLPQLLKSAGYTSGIFGKWHLGDEDDYQPGQRGFDRVFIHGAGGIGQSYPGSCGDVPGNTYLNPLIRSDGTFVQTRGYCTDVFFREAESWVEACHKKDQPFFCYIATNAPHAPYIPPPGGREQAYQEALTAAGITNAKQLANAAPFFAMIENIDANMGRLLKKLNDLGIAEDTLVVFSTDNGTAAGAAVFNDGMRGQKGTPYRGGTRVPAFWRWQGTLPEGVDVPAVTAHIDVLPTLCEITGATIPPAIAEKVEGRSLVPLLRDVAAEWPDRPLVTHVGRWDRGQAAESGYRNCRLREGKWSLVNTKNRPDAWELYDISSDPGEQTNLAALHPDVVTRLVGTYDAWWQSVQPDLVNEDLDGPAENPFKTAYWAQFGPRPTLIDVPYGKHPKQKMHFWKSPAAAAGQPTPLLFFIHGGGWQGGNRMSGLTGILQPVLDAGISVASVEYRFISEGIAEGIEPPVKAPLTDVARALQTVRSKAAEWGIDKKRIVAAGGSAGACSSLWLAFHDDLADPKSSDPVARESTRLSAAAVSGAQTTLDPAQMKEWTPNSRYGGHAFGFMPSPEQRDSQFAQFLAARDTILPWIEEYSPYSLVTPDDPPVALFYSTPPALGQEEKDPTHTANFGVKLEQRLDAAGVPCELVYPGAPDVKHPTLQDAIIGFLKPAYELEN
jgi:arylsulfatase A-like enzyme/acetyl esterase/lipase